MSEWEVIENQAGLQEPNHKTETSSERTLKSSGRILRFRQFKVLPSDRRLVLGERDVEIGGRAFDLLVALLSARGRILSKTEIMRQVWPSTIVDECNLRFQMAMLRRALGRDGDAIKTVPGRGYLIGEDCDLDAPNQPSRDPSATVTFPVEAPRDSAVPTGASTPSPSLRDQGCLHTTAAECDGWARRLVELEAENTRLRLAISNIVGRLILTIDSANVSRQITGTDTGSRAR